MVIINNHTFVAGDEGDVRSSSGVTHIRCIEIKSDAVIIEIKAVKTILAIHEFQLQTYLRMSRLRVGLLLNFHAPRLVDGLKRIIV